MADKIIPFTPQVSAQEPPTYFDANRKKQFEDALVRLIELQNPIEKSLSIINTTHVPAVLRNGIFSLVDDLNLFKRGVEELYIPKQRVYPERQFEAIQTYYANFFQPASSNKALPLITAVTSYENLIGARQLEVIQGLNKEIETKSNELSVQSAQVEAILKKLETPSESEVLSKYAGIYSAASKSNKINANYWIVGGIFLAVGFIVAIVLSINYNWFPNTLALSTFADNKVTVKEIINIPVIVTKVLLISILISLLLFCFRQYSIYMNLSVINEQKKNAFSSYILFNAAIGERDLASKNALLMSLARTIHESINTGFLPSKSNAFPTVNNFDLTKIPVI